MIDTLLFIAPFGPDCLIPAVLPHPLDDRGAPRPLDDRGTSRPLGGRGASHPLGDRGIPSRPPGDRGSCWVLGFRVPRRVVCAPGASAQVAEVTPRSRRCVCRPFLSCLVSQAEQERTTLVAAISSAPSVVRVLRSTGGVARRVRVAPLSACGPYPWIGETCVACRPPTPLQTGR